MFDPFMAVSDALGTPPDHIKVGALLSLGCRGHLRTGWELASDVTSCSRLAVLSARLLPPCQLPPLLPLRQAAYGCDPTLLLDRCGCLLPRRCPQAVQWHIAAVRFHRRHLAHRRLQQDRQNAMDRIRVSTLT